MSVEYQIWICSWLVALFNLVQNGAPVSNCSSHSYCLRHFYAIVRLPAVSDIWCRFLSRVFDVIEPKELEKIRANGNSIIGQTSFWRRRSLVFQAFTGWQSNYLDQSACLKGVWGRDCSYKYIFPVPESLLELSIHTDGRMTHTAPSCCSPGHIPIVTQEDIHVPFGHLDTFWCL